MTTNNKEQSSFHFSKRTILGTSQIGNKDKHYWTEGVYGCIYLQSALVVQLSKCEMSTSMVACLNH